MIFNFQSYAGLGSLLLAGFLMAGCGRNAESSNAAAPKDPGSNSLVKVGFQLDWYPAPEHGGHFQAVVKNYYRDAGLDVTIVSGGPGAYPIQKVAAGQIEFAQGGAGDVILAIKQGLPLLIVGAEMEHDPQAIMVHADSSIKTFKDLDGKSVMGGPGANYVAYLQSHYGIKFNVIPIDYGLARFMADKEFIQQCFISNEPYHAELQGVKTRALLIANSGFDPYRVIFTSRAFARAHPDIVKGFLAATIRGWNDYLNGDATAARAKIQFENPSQTPALMDYSIAAMRRYKLVEGDPEKGERTGLITPERMHKIIDNLIEIKALDAPLPLDQFVSFDFLPAEMTGETKP